MRDPSPIRKTRSTKVCYQCDPELYPNGKIIFDDPLAKQDSKGRWHCSDCQETERRRTLLKIYGPNHVNTRYFLEHEDKMIGAWNQAAKKVICYVIISYSVTWWWSLPLSHVITTQKIADRLLNSYVSFY